MSKAWAPSLYTLSIATVRGAPAPAERREIPALYSLVAFGAARCLDVRHPVRRMVAAAATVARASPSGSNTERDHEGTTVGQADVREVQDHPPPRARAGDLSEPTTQAASGVGTALARISGVNIPLNKRVEIGLTYIYGVGRPTSNRVLAELGISPDTYVRDLTEEEVSKLRDLIDREHTVEGD